MEIENERKIEIVKKLSKNKLDIIVFPELYVVLKRKDNIEKIIKDLEKDKIVIFGVELTEEKRNVLVLSYNGEIHEYTKIHLTTEEREEAGFVHGDKFVVVDTHVGKIGLGICYDLIFPEHARILALKGAEIIVYSSTWPSYDYEGWDLFTRARCRENQVFGLFSCGFGEYVGIFRLGRSRIVSPFGRILAQSESPRREFSLAKATLDPELLEMARGIDWPKENYFKERKPHLYKDIVKEIKFI